MKSETDKILSMLEEGTISAAEADELLAAVEEEEIIEDALPPLDAETFEPPPDMAEVRSSWRLPFNISLIIMTLSGSLLFRWRRAAGLARLMRDLLLLPLTLLAGLTAVILYLSKNGPWLFMRIRSGEGDGFNLSLPFPLHWVRGGLQLAQTQIPDEDVQEKIAAAAEFLEAVEAANLQDPLSIDIKDEGDSIEIYLG